MRKSITFLTLEIEVEFDYQPEEKQVRYYPDGSGYPGCDAKVEISNIYFKENDVTSFFEESGLIYKVESELLYNELLHKS